MAKTTSEIERSIKSLIQLLKLILSIPMIVIGIIIQINLREIAVK